MYVDLNVSVILICVDEFSCGNGECIDSTSVCDGTLHCKDGSDESLPACDFSLVSAAEKASSISTRLRRAPKTVRFSSCVVPPQPKNGTRKLNRYFCDGDEDCDVDEGSSLRAGSQLTYVCESGFRLEGNSHVYCGGQGKWSPIPVCKRIECQALSTASTLAVCSRRGNRTNCEEAVLPGTRAVVSCKAGYREDTNAAITRRHEIECEIDGEWRPKPIICIPACGVATDRKTPFVFNGAAARIADFPWHATLYRGAYKKKQPRKEFICGATVIHTKLVLTAAHCVYDEVTGSINDPNTLHVATGNVFREFDSPFHDSKIVQKSPVRNVWRHCSYHGRQGNYLGDIALLELQNPFTFSSILVPACLDTSGFSHQILEPGSSGRVAGFGTTQHGDASAILQTITVPYVTYSDCKNSRRGSEDEVLISDDKFCAGYINGTQAVCQGDSGGGLVFQKNDLWYVMGVVSVTLGDDTRIGVPRCEPNYYTLYTDVATHINWIRDIMYRMESGEYFPPCDNTDPKCIPVNSESTVTNCFLSGRWKICDFPVPSQTKAKISCREGYVRYTTGQDSIKCTSTGEWNPEPVDCVPLATTPDVSLFVPNVSTVATTSRRGFIAGQKCAAYASSILPYSLKTIGGIQCTEIRTPKQIRAFRHAGMSEYSYMARIGFNAGLLSIAWKCGATLISENYVISISFCSQHPEYGKAAWIQVGHWNNYQGYGLTPQKRRVAQIMRHPSLRGGGYHNDIALYKMDRAITFDEAILPACLYGLPNVDATSPTTVKGWLRRGFHYNAGFLSVLWTNDVQVADHATCNFNYPGNPRQPDGFADNFIICAYDGIPNNCKELRAGSALILPSNNHTCMRQLVGIGGVGMSCNSNKPEAYTRIYPYISWIESIVWPEA